MKENIRPNIPTLSLEQLDLLSKLRNEVRCDLMFCKTILSECDWNIDEARIRVENHLKNYYVTKR